LYPHRRACGRCACRRQRPAGLSPTGSPKSGVPSAFQAMAWARVCRPRILQRVAGDLLDVARMVDQDIGLAVRRGGKRIVARAVLAGAPAAGLNTGCGDLVHACGIEQVGAAGAVSMPSA
jgi:hypothetical protein